MKTDDLIRALAADTTTSASVERVLALALLAAFMLAAALFLASMGWRADIAQVATEFSFLFKFVVTLTLALTAAFVASRLARPDGTIIWPALALAAAPLLLAAAVFAELTAMEPGMHTTKLVGTSWITCLTFIPLVSLPFLVAALFALRHGAPTRPALTGAVAGLLAGGLGATIYAVYCVEDSALFLLTWYSLAIAMVTVAGAIAGARLLRW